MNTKELEDYFKSDKVDWYEKDEDGYKIWDFDKVSKFW